VAETAFAESTTAYFYEELTGTVKWKGKKIHISCPNTMTAGITNIILDLPTGAVYNSQASTSVKGVFKYTSGSKHMKSTATALSYYDNANN
jgi:hypothetical protein